MGAMISFSIVVLVIAVTFAIGYNLFKLQRHTIEKTTDFLFAADADGKAKPLVIGHRGGQFEAPENTLAAIRTAHRNGATAVELDLAFTEDGYGVIVHDETFDRTTNGTGYVSKTRFYEMRKLNAASKVKILRYSGGTDEPSFEQIPTLKEVVVLCKELGVKIILDVKSDPTATANAVHDLSKEIPDMAKYVMVTSFYPSVLYMVKRKCPQFLTALIWRHDYCGLMIDGKPRFTGWMHILMYIVDILGERIVHSCLPEFLGIEAVSMHKEHISRRYLNHWHSKNIEVMSWTVNNPLEKEYFLNHFKIPIITDSILNFEHCPDQQF